MVSFERRDSDRPCETGGIIFVGVGDSCNKHNNTSEKRSKRLCQSSIIEILKA